MGVEFKKCSKCGNTVPYFTEAFKTYCCNCNNSIKATDINAKNELTKKYSAPRARSEQWKNFCDLAWVSFVNTIIWGAAFGALVGGDIFATFYLGCIALIISYLWLPKNSRAVNINSNNPGLIQMTTILFLVIPIVPPVIFIGILKLLS